jgi:hypothetical protein
MQTKGLHRSRRPRRRTEDNNVEDQDNKTDDAAAAAVFPCIAVGCGGEGLRGHGHGEEGELDEGGHEGG